MSDAGDCVRAYIEKVWNQGSLDGLDELATPDFSYHLNGQAPLDRTRMRSFLAAMRTAFPDWRVETLDLISEAGTVAVRWTGHATHQGVFRGVPPTGRRITVAGMNMYRVAGGRISVEWEQMDSLGMVQQLGLVPPP
jgi:steroid delta-isomerase-like uncharacterized protein